MLPVDFDPAGPAEPARYGIDDTADDCGTLDLHTDDD
jgi:hypothetical protein